ncbi:hypothetical protein [Dyadobacter diqingensis]|uniref:hypothetical protein n=1 Tax=Dyadobacter diqingensis TaxID=2938121 RepID=UPI0020C190F7|nr:hypothetical protein [Dyadobacter diqingensis]
MSHFPLIKIISPIVLTVTMLCGAAPLFAQVKIGTNPTTINAANNLEIEASTAGRKTSVDKTTGQVTIADGTQGLNKILTSDANGAASWQSPAAQDAPAIFSVTSTANQTSFYGANDKVDFGVKNLDKNNNFDLATDTFTVPANGTGIYQFGTIFSTLNQAYLQGVYVYIYVNGVVSRSIGIANCAPGAGIGGSGFIVTSLNAGDLVTIRVTPSLSTPGTSITFYHFSLSVAMISK